MKYHVAIYCDIDLPDETSNPYEAFYEIYGSVPGFVDDMHIDGALDFNLIARL